jgi:hypothetical protein
MMNELEFWDMISAMDTYELAAYALANSGEMTMFELQTILQELCTSMLDQYESPDEYDEDDYDNRPDDGEFNG